MVRPTATGSNEEPRKVTIDEAFAIFDALDQELDLSDKVADEDRDSLATYMVSIKEQAVKHDVGIKMAQMFGDSHNMAAMLTKCYRLGFMYGRGNPLPKIELVDSEDEPEEPPTLRLDEDEGE